jgi:hypothetical protein
MGLEATCEVRHGRQVSSGKARLEEKELLFRADSADFRLKIPLSAARAEAKRGALRVEWPEGVATFALGRDAEKWALRIRSPRGLLDKLGVEPGARVAVIGIDDAEFLRQLALRTTDLSEGRARKESDVIVVGMTKKADLHRLETLRASIKSGGAIWVVWPKGRKELREDDVRAFGTSVGLVDVKVAAFSATHSALKLVIPLRLRPRR